MGKIENLKSYTGRELENCFFRPMLAGDDARGLGIRVLYNMPVPTTLHFWRRGGDILHSYKNNGWQGSAPADRTSKTIELHRVKAEAAYTADEYFSLVCDTLTRSRVGSLEDLTGTQLEEAETTMFREAVAESIRATMWLGDTTRTSGLDTFDGFVRRIVTDAGSSAEIASEMYTEVTAASAADLLKKVWTNARTALRELKSEGQLAFFVTSDVWTAYEEHLLASDAEAAYIAGRDGSDDLRWRGIPVVDVKLADYMADYGDTASSFVILTDRRNLALALNTDDFPGTEVRMWYNPDLMENRQRAVFMAGADYMMPELLSVAYMPGNGE